MAPAAKRAEMLAQFQQRNQQQAFQLQQANRVKTPEQEAQDIRIAQARRDPGPASGQFGGTGMDAQAWNTLIRGEVNTPQYAAAYAHLTQPKTQMVPNPADNGQSMILATVTPSVPFPAPGRAAAAQAPQQGAQPPAEGPSAPAAGAGAPTVAPIPGQQGATKPISREQQSLTALTTEATKALGMAKNIIFERGNGSGPIDRGVVATMYADIPGTDGASARQAMRAAIGNVLYLKTGAAATPKEIENTEATYLPSPFDSDQKIRQKFELFETFINSFQSQKAQTAPGTERVIQFDAQGNRVHD